jgi:hypothetical protein
MNSASFNLIAAQTVTRRSRPPGRCVTKALHARPSQESAVAARSFLLPDQQQDASPDFTGSEPILTVYPVPNFHFSTIQSAHTDAPGRMAASVVVLTAVLLSSSGAPLPH